MPNNPNAVANLIPYSKTNPPKNPGRKKGVRSRSTIIRELLGYIKEDKNPITGQMEKRELEYWLMLKKIQLAMDSRRKSPHTANNALNDLMDWIYGKQTQKHAINDDIPRPVGFNFVPFKEPEKSTNIPEKNEEKQE